MNRGIKNTRCQLCGKEVYKDKERYLSGHGNCFHKSCIKKDEDGSEIIGIENNR